MELNDEIDSLLIKHLTVLIDRQKKINDELGLKIAHTRKLINESNNILKTKKADKNGN